MTPEVAVAERILDITAVTAIVNQRVYVGKLPQQATYPAVIVRLVHEPTDYHLRGGLRFQARVQVDAYIKESETEPYTNVTSLADLIHGDDAGSGLSGWFGSSFGSPSFHVTGILRIDREDGYEPGELRLLRQRQDYWVYFRH